LHLSKDEQRKRLLKRLDDPKKNWKFSENDVHERSYWDGYQRAYEEMLSATSTEAAPWYVVPADRKWFVRAAIANVVAAKLDALGLQYPRLHGETVATFERFREQLEAE
jgi:polyphosphate kinase 2 (PPK2 family)